MDPATLLFTSAASEVSWPRRPKLFLANELSSAGLSQRDRDLIAKIAPHVAEAFRRALLVRLSATGFSRFEEEVS